MKIDATDPKMPEWRKHLFPCDCGESEFVHINWWADEDPSDRWGFLEVVPAIWAQRPLERLKAIAKIIVGRPFYHGGIILNKETVERLRETLDELELDQKRERQVNEDGKAEHTDKDEHIHEDANP